MLLPLAALAMLPTDTPPAPVGALPSPRQLAWHKKEYYAFVHFGPNTFTGQEWGSGKEKTEVFDPKHLDCRQWCKVFKDAGMTGVIITAKHHDGFCLWPSKYSTHTVRESNWKGGKGDVLKELSQACREFGLGFGVYLSPWDRNHPTYGTSAYNETFKNMLREVLGNYGKTFEVWFDGANGEGPNGKKQVYDWPGFIEVVRKLQPGAVVFSDAGPDIRWVGNEAGHSDPTCWATLDRDKFVPGDPKWKQLTQGHEDGTHWVPAECDVSIRRGWFWRASEDDTVKSGATLMDLYMRSEGQNSSLLLNVPANSDGLISAVDQKALMDFKALRDRTFANPLAKSAKVSASSERGRPFAARNAMSKTGKYWVPADGDARPTVTLTWGRPHHLGVLDLREHIELGQRVQQFMVEVRDGGTWKAVEVQTTVGHRRLLDLKGVRGDGLRVTFNQAKGPVCLSKIEVYEAP
ncbi:MAG: alpha-L-fucosidase [Fimbriimonadaceae bacterium]|nr:alpha-L-fucosidase [Fimbriimonadaceae bacterium]